MGTSVFPNIPSVIWAVRKTPQFSTSVQRSVSGKELRAQLYTYPIWELELTYEILQDRVINSQNDIQVMIGFFLARAGSFDNFNYSDPDDNAVTNQAFGTGDAVTTQFQLARTYAGYTEPVFRTNGAPTIKINGVTKTVTTDYTINAEGLVTFVSAPGNTLPLTWTGSFYYRVRFADDMNDFEQFWRFLWQLKKLRLETVK